MKNVLVLISILFLSFNVLAKSPGKTQGKSKANVSSKKYAKDAFKFDLRVYYKLKFPDRKKYLMAYVDFLRAMNSELQDKKNAEFNLMRLLFPTADAQVYGKDFCYTGGIYYSLAESVSGSCGSGYKAESYFPEQIKVAFSGCTNNNRCGAYLGVDSSNNGFCYTTEGNATDECLKQSSPEAIDRLVQLLKNDRYDAKAIALNKALELDLRNNNLISQACIDKTDKGGKCAKLSSVVAEFKNKAQFPTSSPISLGNEQTGKGCTQAELDSINSQFPSKTVSTPAGDREAKGQVDSMWYNTLKLGAAVCPTGESYDDLVNKLGICSLAPGAKNVDVEMALRLNDELQKAVTLYISGQSKDMTKAQESQFTNFFGLTPTELKNVVCATHKTNASGYARQLAKNLPLQVYGATDQKMFSERRERFKACVNNNMVQQPDALGNMIWRSNGNMNTCHLQKAALSTSDMKKNIDSYKGKLFFQDGTTGNCYRLHSVGDSCSGMVKDIPTLAEKTQVQAACEKEPKPERGSIVEGLTYLRLEPVYKTGNIDRVVSSNGLTSQFSFYEIDCGKNATEPCNLDNDNCGRGFDNTSDR